MRFTRAFWEGFCEGVEEAVNSPWYKALLIITLFLIILDLVVRYAQ